tara:strand:+ start:45 stop:386 length:342 start_codon:yes stop_codon:yes gene_type:complete
MAFQARCLKTAKPNQVNLLGFVILIHNAVVGDRGAGGLHIPNSRNVANKNTHCYHNGHPKVFKNTQASLAFFHAFSLLRIFECRGAGDVQVLRKCPVDIFSAGASWCLGFRIP